MRAITCVTFDACGVARTGLTDTLDHDSSCPAAALSPLCEYSQLTTCDAANPLELFKALCPDSPAVDDELVHF